MKPIHFLPITLLAAVLVACGGDDTRHVDRDKPTPVEYMPVDGYVMGFWVMDTQAHCATCINDHSPYGDALHARSADGQPATPVLIDGGKVGRVAVFADDGQLMTLSSSTFSNTVIGERFTLHLRARTDQVEPQPVLSLAEAGGGTALTLDLGRDSVLAELPSQGKRLLGSLNDTDGGWHEIVLASDGTQVTLTADCTVIETFTREPGVPVLGKGGLSLAVGAGFTGQVDLVRVSRQNEGNLFCDG